MTEMHEARKLFYEHISRYANTLAIPDDKKKQFISAQLAKRFPKQSANVNKEQKS